MRSARTRAETKSRARGKPAKKGESTKTAGTTGGGKRSSGKQERTKKKAETRPSFVRIRGAGFHFPEKAELSADVIKRERPNYLFNFLFRVNIGSDYIRVAGPEDTPATLTAAAAKRALENAGAKPEQIDQLLTVGCTPPDFDMWSLPAKVSQLLGLRRETEALGVGDVGCAGSYAAIRTALPMMMMPDGPARVLVATGCLNPGDHFFPPATMFGDGAGAVVLERVAGSTAKNPNMPRVVRADLYSFSHLIDAFNCGGGLNLLRSEGRLEPGSWRFDIKNPEIYDTLRTTNFELGTGALLKSLAKAGWRPDSLRWVAGDNVSAKVGLALAYQIGVPLERVLSENCFRYGHAFTADLFVNLATLLETRTLAPGDRIACVGMGIGQHWGVLLLEA